MLPRIFEHGSWYMRPSERAALSGLLAELCPGVALEIGTAAGGSLVCLADHAGRVHSFDLSPPAPGLRELGNVTFHTGDSHVLLPRVMEQLAAEGVLVEFALVDGDHSAEGVRRDVEDLLAASAFMRGIVVIHDTANPEVRDGLERVNYEECSKVTWVDLDWLPGYVAKDTGVAWAGLGLIVIDAAAGSSANSPARADYSVPFPELLQRLDADHRGSADSQRSAVPLEMLERLLRSRTVTGQIDRVRRLMPRSRRGDT